MKRSLSVLSILFSSRDIYRIQLRREEVYKLFFLEALLELRCVTERLINEIPCCSRKSLYTSCIPPPSHNPFYKHVREVQNLWNITAIDRIYRKSWKLPKNPKTFIEEKLKIIKNSEQIGTLNKFLDSFNGFL